MKSILSIIILATGLTATATAGHIVSNKDNTTGSMYTNPIVDTDYSDPDVVTTPDGTTFYLTASSFQSTPGLPILKSYDLVNWELVNYALQQVPPVEYYNQEPRHGKGVWAPCMRYHDGWYYIYWGDPDFGIYMVKTQDPEQAWSEPVLVKAGKGLIDPTPLWDNDGRVYLANAWAASRAGFNSVITISEMNSDGTAVISNPRVVFDGNDGVNHTIEGPKLYRHGNYYYILAPAGGVEQGWQLALRSKHIYGPYEAKIVMAQGDTDINGPHQGGWVTAADSTQWFIHFQDRGPHGRILHLNPLQWIDGWPVIGNDPDHDGYGEPVAQWAKPVLTDSMPGTAHPELLYQWHGNYMDQYGFPTYDALMRIYGYQMPTLTSNLWTVPNLWLQKIPARAFTLDAKVRISAKASSEEVSSGLVVMGRSYARLGVTKRGERYILQYVVCADAEHGALETITELEEVAPTRTYSAGLYDNMELDMFLRLKADPTGLCRFYYSLDGKKYTEAGQFSIVAGKWIGAKMGFYSITPLTVNDKGWIDVMDIKLD